MAARRRRSTDDNADWESGNARRQPESTPDWVYRVSVAAMARRCSGFKKITFPTDFSKGL